MFLKGPKMGQKWAEMDKNGPKMGQKWVKNLQKMGKKMAKNQRKITQFAFRKGSKVMNQFLNELAKNSQKFLIRK